MLACLENADYIQLSFFVLADPTGNGVFRGGGIVPCIGHCAMEITGTRIQRQIVSEGLFFREYQIFATKIEKSKT